jgi:uncharacterized protein (TIGR03435 family)
MRTVGLVAAILALALTTRFVSLSAQAGPTLEPRQAFEVTSVKVNRSNTRTPMQWHPGGRFVMGLPIFSVVSIGYQVPGYRIEGLPEWARTTYFDIDARAAQQPEIEERPAYYRGLLVDRFGLVAHVAQREMDVYSLTLARSDRKPGPGLRPSNVDCSEAITANRARTLAGERPQAPPPGARPTCGAVGGAAAMTAGAVELTVFTGMLAGALERPIVDKTGLQGRFDIDFRAAPARTGTNPPPSIAELPSIFTAVQEQLGLKLTPDRALVDVLVIDRLEIPTEN